MEDSRIVELYWRRAEDGIRETAVKYGAYCSRIAYGILQDRSDVEEVVNDTYLAAWNSIPPHRPKTLSTYLGKLTRRIAIDRLRAGCAQKRGGTQLPLALEELAELAAAEQVEDAVCESVLTDVLNQFLKELPEMQRRVFVCRYWYLDSITEICERFGFSESKVKSMLSRTRARLRVCLERRGML